MPVLTASEMSWGNGREGIPTYDTCTPAHGGISELVINGDFYLVALVHCNDRSRELPIDQRSRSSEAIRGDVDGDNV